MRRQLIFLDIDGTLTEPGSNVPPDSALHAIKKARENGHKVFLSSGRNYGMLSPLLPYGFDGLSGCNGGYVMYGNDVIYDCPMTEKQRKCSMEVFKKNGIFRTIESREKSYTDEGFKIFLMENANTGSNSELLRWREQIESSLDIRPMSEYRGEPIYKMVFMARDRKELEEPQEVLQEEFDFCIQETDKYGIINGELVNRKFNKGAAIERICNHLNHPLEDTIAIGDSMNDLEMIQTAAVGICMENGSETLKKLSDEVCPPVDKDGLLVAFLNHGLCD